jgi:hypothetical protein
MHAVDLVEFRDTRPDSVGQLADLADTGLVEVRALVEKLALTATPSPKMIVEMTGSAQILRLMLMLTSPGV